MKSTITLTILILLAGLISTAAAHPPNELSIEYNLSTTELKVKLSHATLDRTEHFIRKYSVYKNGELIEEKRVNKQTSAYSFSTTLNIEAEEGDEISVKVNCSEGGSKTASLTASSSNQPPKDSE